MDATKCLKYEQPCILNEVLETGNKKEVIDQHLQVQSMSKSKNTVPTIFACTGGKILAPL